MGGLEEQTDSNLGVFSIEGEREGRLGEWS